MSSIRAFAPASIGNLAAGFDTLGAALRPMEGPPLGDWVEVREAPRAEFSWDGPFAAQVPADPGQNLALRARDTFARVWGRALPPLAIHLHKGLPVGSGLGSSSASVVATLRALDLLFEHPLDDQHLLLAAGEAEAQASGAIHLDNVAPSLLGGVRFIDALGRAVALPFPETLTFVIATPELNLLTREARAALPEKVPFRLAVDHACNLASLVHALQEKDLLLLKHILRDLLAEPHRAHLVPGFFSVKTAALASGAWGCSLSGAGPAIFALAESDHAKAVGFSMREAWAEQGVTSQILLCALDTLGARAIEAS